MYCQRPTKDHHCFPSKEIESIHHGYTSFINTSENESASSFKANILHLTFNHNQCFKNSP